MSQANAHLTTPPPAPERPSRRSVLTAAAALPALVVPSYVGANAAPDPIFAAIEKHRSAALAFLAAANENLRLGEELPKDQRRSSVTSRPSFGSRWLAGRQAKLFKTKICRFLPIFADLRVSKNDIRSSQHSCRHQRCPRPATANHRPAEL
jgi:hypothetical protein